MEKNVCFSPSMGQVPNFLVGEENKGDVQCRFIKKDHQMNSILKNPKPNSYRESMR
jgi:hypothetical protein